MGLLEVQEARSVSVGLPHLDGSGQTNYKGNAKPANNKECILIIDHETGELTLERLDSQIMLKKTRPEKTDKSLNSYEGRTAANPFEVREQPLMPGRPRPHTPQSVPRPQT